MRTLTRILIPLLLAAVLLAACPLAVSAAATATIAFSSSTLTPGETLTVTVTFSADTVGAVDASLSYDAAVLQFQSGDGVSGGGGVLKISNYASSEGKSLRTAITFKAIAAGSSLIRITESAVYAWDETLAGNPTAGATVKVTDQTLSQNADLKSLRLSAGALSPAFSPAVTAYTVTVANNVDSLTVSAVPADDGATVSVSGSAALPVGTSRRTITVTAAGGATKTYTLTITRRGADATTPTGEVTGTTDDPTATTAPDTDSPVRLTYEGTFYTVATLDGQTLPDGFTAGETLCGERTVAAALSENGAVCLLWLVSEENPESGGGFFVYNAEADELFPYRPLSTANGVFVLRPAGTQTPGEGLTAAQWDIEGETVSVWAFSQPERADFCVIYAMDTDGLSGFYCYDTLTKTMQRYVALPTAAPVAAPTVPTAPASEEDAVIAGWTLFGVPIAWYAAGLLLIICIVLAVLVGVFRRRSITPPRHLE